MGRSLRSAVCIVLVVGCAPKTSTTTVTSATAAHPAITTAEAPRPKRGVPVADDSARTERPTRAPEEAPPPAPLTPWFSGAIVLGTAGLIVGTVSVAGNPDRGDEATTFTIAALGIGVVGLATALVLHALEP